VISAVALALFFVSLPFSRTSTQPLASASEPAYLSCTTWTGKAWTIPTARSAQTRVMESPKGFRAYAEVKVAVKDGSCENTTTLYVASGADGKFKIVYSKTNGGNGVRLIGWSPAGDKLLAEVNTWEYETDGGYVHIPVLYDASTDSAKEIPELNQALKRHLVSDCEFDEALQAWTNSGQVLIKISRPAKDESYEQKSCVQRLSTFVFDLQNKAIKLYQPPKAN
jgi:hypothetical protein